MEGIFWGRINYLLLFLYPIVVLLLEAILGNSGYFPKFSTLLVFFSITKFVCFSDFGFFGEGKEKKRREEEREKRVRGCVCACACVCGLWLCGCPPPSP